MQQELQEFLSGKNTSKGDSCSINNISCNAISMEIEMHQEHHSFFDGNWNMQNVATNRTAYLTLLIEAKDEIPRRVDYDKDIYITYWLHKSNIYYYFLCRLIDFQYDHTRETIFMKLQAHPFDVLPKTDDEIEATF